MAGKDQYKASDFIEAIKGSDGIITTIANRIGCSWHTAKKYIDEYATVREAYEAECEMTTDAFESILTTNARAAKRIQNDAIKNGDFRGAIVDTADAKWWLTKKGKGRGFVDRQELTGPNGGDVTIRIVNDR
jgi:hypothetical protein